jgi:hypothetical protein
MKYATLHQTVNAKIFTTLTHAIEVEPSYFIPLIYPDNPNLHTHLIKKMVHCKTLSNFAELIDTDLLCLLNEYLRKRYNESLTGSDHYPRVALNKTIPSVPAHTQQELKEIFNMLEKHPERSYPGFVITQDKYRNETGEWNVYKCFHVNGYHFTIAHNMDVDPQFVDELAYEFSYDVPGWLEFKSMEELLQLVEEALHDPTLSPQKKG